jgi:hypothetical protein
MLICALIPFPFVDFEFVMKQEGINITYSYDSIVAACQLIKIVVIAY